MCLKDCISDEKLSGFDKVLVSGSLIPYGGKVFKAAKVTKNGKKVLEVVEVAGKGIKIWNRTYDDILDRIVEHSYQKHIIEQKEFGNLFKNSDQWREYLKSVMQNPSDYFQGGGKTLYWDDRLEAIIIDNPANPTAFRAEAGKEYFEIEVNKLKKIEGIK